ncbi:Putative uncharacterized protein [Lactobacillus equicursoris 66c]|uniref:Prenylated flavin chaperone LpdD-like domain-containing protein n=1 Tax=Lactobacillus equicursoris 66c TaxID=872326 RepID=K0NQ29_9LACO|nr:Putative uncharacterized protein [Lactobacillus equicursoris 66c]
MGREIVKQFKVSMAGYTITAVVHRLNRDLVVLLYGGDLPHVGSVLCYDKASEEKTEVNYYSHDGRYHKDIIIARVFFEKIKHTLPGNLNLTAGVHIDGISQEQIKAAPVMTEKLAEQVTDWLKKEAGNFKDPQYTSHFK